MIDHSILARQVAAVRDAADRIHDVASNHVEDLLRLCDTLADAAINGSSER